VPRWSINTNAYLRLVASGVRFLAFLARWRQVSLRTDCSVCVCVCVCSTHTRTHAHRRLMSGCAIAIYILSISVLSSHTHREHLPSTGQQGRHCMLSVERHPLCSSSRHLRQPRLASVPCPDGRQTLTMATRGQMFFAVFVVMGACDARVRLSCGHASMNGLFCRAAPRRWRPYSGPLFPRAVDWTSRASRTGSRRHEANDNRVFRARPNCC
jgi:hypothetical protein